MEPVKPNKTITKRFTQLVEKLMKTEEELAQVEAQKKELEQLLQSVNLTNKKSKIITIKSATKIEFINIDHIICCKADEAYTHIYLENHKVITASKTLSAFECILEEHSFFRISKSHLINPTQVVTFFKDRNQILLNGNLLLDVARRRRIDFLKTLD